MPYGLLEAQWRINEGPTFFKWCLRNPNHWKPHPLFFGNVITPFSAKYSLHSYIQLGCLSQAQNFPLFVYVTEDGLWANMLKGSSVNVSLASGEQLTASSAVRFSNGEEISLEENGQRAVVRIFFAPWNN